MTHQQPNLTHPTHHEAPQPQLLRRLHLPAQRAQRVKGHPLVPHHHVGSLHGVISHHRHARFDGWLQLAVGQGAGLPCSSWRAGMLLVARRAASCTLATLGAVLVLVCWCSCKGILDAAASTRWGWSHAGALSCIPCPSTTLPPNPHPPAPPSAPHPPHAHA